MSASIDAMVTPVLPSGSRLRIHLADELVAPNADSNLLVAFEFSDASRVRPPGVVATGLPVLSKQGSVESWWYEGPVVRRENGSAQVSICEDYTVVCVQVEDTPATCLRELTRSAYADLLAAVDSTKHKQIVKIWYYFDEINTGDDDDERYRQFSVGRAQTFSDFNISTQSAPAGTAVGTHGFGKLTLVAVSSSRKYQAAENPRQISAYRYPRQYGPSSPFFSRSGLVYGEDHNMFIISGTAAIVGHESLYPFDLERQAAELFRNLAELRSAAAGLAPAINLPDLDAASVLRVYLRDPAHLDAAAKMVQKNLRRTLNNVAFVRGNICRRELMIEIDGIELI